MRLPRGMGFLRLRALALLLVTVPLDVFAAEAACFPACREGYLCSQGQCISACNPACEAGLVCNAAAQCIPAATSAPAAPESPRAVEASPGWADGAATF